MLLQFFKSKIHRATVTQANLHYVGSITIDEVLMEAANLYEGEKVQIVNNNNGERFETYVIKGEKNSGMVCLNGDIIIVISYALMTPEEAKSFHPISIFVDEKNQIKEL